MDIKIIEKNLKTKYIGRNIIYLEEVDSTQKLAKNVGATIGRPCSKEITNGTVIITNMQTKGIGTHGRVWYTEPNVNILMTIIVKPNCNISKLEGLTKKVATDIKEVIWNLYKIKLEIKEPNDLMLNNKKIAGILTETKLEKEMVKELFIGIGFNVNQESFPKEIEKIATSLKKEMKNNYSREEIIAEVLSKIDEHL